MFAYESLRDKVESLLGS